MAAGFGSRARTLLDAMARAPRPEQDVPRRTMFHAIARLATGHDTATALKDIAAANENPENAAMFFRHANIDAYLRFGDRWYTPELRDQVRRRMLNYEYRPDGTENHKIMTAVAGYLVAQTWPEWKEAAQTKARCGAYLDDYLNRVARYGQGEFDSTTYSVFYLNTLATLQDFARDPALKNKARLMSHWFLADAAGEWLNGRSVGAHSRDYHTIHGPERPGAGTVAFWLYFGGRAPNLTNSEAHFSVINAVSSYRMPEILGRIASDRARPYVHREAHDRMPPGGTVEGRGPYITRGGISKYNYVAPGWALGSTADGREGDIIWSGQMRRWSLDWDTERPGGALFFTHPFPDNDGDTGGYLREWRGSSPYEQVLQHEGALVTVYNIPEGARYKMVPRDPAIRSDRDPYIEGFFPAGALLRVEEDPSGWLFCHSGPVLIAVRPLRPWRWVEPRRDPAPPGGAGKPGRLRSDGRKNAVIVEAAGVREFARDGEPEGERVAGELNRFREQILGRARVDAGALDDARPRVTYTTRTGATLRIAYDGERTVNGKPLDFARWPLLDSPFLHADVGAGALTMRHGGETLSLDFVRWRETAGREAGK